ncbi:hypothetical protein, partial [Caballeronia mineralivorans]|uniref:hypothetical protein n=1 Tax=Caballeronia mineralivorans TaxID=2010198 RepID=UPI002AFE1527
MLDASWHPHGGYRWLAADFRRSPASADCCSCVKIAPPVRQGERRARQTARIGVLSAWLCAMGFEQLAELKEQLAKEQ